MRASIFFLSVLLSLSAHAAPAPVADAAAFTGWTDNRDYDDDVINVSSLPAASLCAGSDLYPAHPQQDLKRYHGGLWGSYDLSKVRGGDDVCLTPLRPNGLGVSYCARADLANYVILSDVFTDGCGHLVRGFIEVQFMTSEESMGTLESLGRTVYPNPHSDYAGDLRPGGTYAVPRSKFLRITPPFVGDAASSARLQREALAAGYSLNSTTHLYAEPAN